MGMNYYLHQNVCPHCGRGNSPLHIGKSSGGWCFSLHVTPGDDINDLEDWVRLWSQENTVIKDEEDEEVSPAEMMDIITNRKWDSPQTFPNRWYKSQEEFNQLNYCTEGPYGLARHNSDHLVKHGAGTWDCIRGEFE